MDREQATNKLLFALSQNPQGMTTQGLSEFTGHTYDKEDVKRLMGGQIKPTGHVKKGYAGPESGTLNMPATLWKLKTYVPGSEADEDLKARIKAGSN